MYFIKIVKREKISDCFVLREGWTRVSIADKVVFKERMNTNNTNYTQKIIANFKQDFLYLQTIQTTNLLNIIFLFL